MSNMLSEIVRKFTRTGLKAIINPATDRIERITIGEGTLERPAQVPMVLAQSAVPVILAPNGTVAANGTITLGTALPTIYSGGAWVRLPAGAVVGGSAGLYWTVFSSTTVGVVYTNFVDPSSQFIPYIPSGTLVAATGSNAAYTQATGADITLANITVPGGAMGTGGAVRSHSFMQSNNNANNKISKLLFASQGIVQRTLTTMVSTVWNAVFRNRGVANSQVVVAPTNGNAFGSGESSGGYLVLAVNTATDQSLAFTGQLAVATDYIILEAFTVEVLPV